MSISLRISLASSPGTASSGNTDEVDISKRCLAFPPAVRAGSNASEIRLRSSATSVHTCRAIYRTNLSGEKFSTCFLPGNRRLDVDLDVCTRDLRARSDGPMPNDLTRSTLAFSDHQTSPRKTTFQKASPPRLLGEMAPRPTRPGRHSCRHHRVTWLRPKALATLRKCSPSTIRRRSQSATGLWTVRA